MIVFMRVLIWIDRWQHKWCWRCVSRRRGWNIVWWGRDRGGVWWQLEWCLGLICWCRWRCRCRCRWRWICWRYIRIRICISICISIWVCISVSINSSSIHISPTGTCTSISIISQISPIIEGPLVDSRPNFGPKIDQEDGSKYNSKYQH